MTQQDGITSGPNLSQYFANDPPSLFDEIGKRSDGNIVFKYFYCA